MYKYIVLAVLINLVSGSPCGGCKMQETTTIIRHVHHPVETVTINNPTETVTVAATVTEVGATVTATVTEIGATVTINNPAETVTEIGATVTEDVTITILQPGATVTEDVTITILQPGATVTEACPTSIPREIVNEIPVTSGDSAVLTYFTDTTTQCYGENIPEGNALAINPLLLGFTAEQWTASYANADPSTIPWCGKTLTLTVNGATFTGIVIDTCDPVGSQFPDPNTGEIIGGRCDYEQLIDLYGEPGRQFLMSNVGDDFFDGRDGSVTWSLE
jgi:archaellum component FlaF (FlaF/FlaG flagellin family)